LQPAIFLPIRILHDNLCLPPPSNGWIGITLLFFATQSDRIGFYPALSGASKAFFDRLKSATTDYQADVPNTRPMRVLSQKTGKNRNKTGKTEMSQRQIALPFGFSRKLKQPLYRRFHIHMFGVCSFQFFAILAYFRALSPFFPKPALMR
jgi:hypothetical protein